MRNPSNGATGARRLFWRPRLWAPVLAALAALAGLLQGQQVHRNGFEGREPAWVKGTADAPFRETVHEMTELHAHGGQHSERIQLTAESGTAIYYYYPTPKAPLGEELNGSLWLRGNRHGVQLMGRLVLPHETNPNNLQERLTTLVRGDQYQLVGRWQRLELRNPLKLAKEQQQFMRAELRRDVNFADAYIDQLVLNLYSGPGLTEVWIDDLEIGPVAADTSPFQTTSRPITAPGRNGPAGLPRAPGRGTLVELKQDNLFVGGKGFFIRGIRHSDTPLETLRDAGFNTIWVDAKTVPAVLEEAVKLGFWVVPSLPVTAEDPRLASRDSLTNDVTRFSVSDAVLFWDVGDNLVQEQKDQVLRGVQVVRAADGQKPIGADIWDGFRPYTRTIDLVGIRRWPLMTSLGLPQFREWLDQRRLLARPGSFTWTWVQTHLPDWYTQLVYDRPGAAGFDEPIGPQPEQIRLLTYCALGAGSRGIGFWSDKFLANTHQGRDRLLELALLNQELQMLTPLLTSAESPRWIDTSQAEVKAAVLRTEHGILVLPMWLGNGAQFVPGQSATAKLTVVVPEVPRATIPWLVSPVEVRTLEYERTLGGTKVTIPEFGLTAAIVFTAENTANGIVVRFQEQQRRLREQAAHWAHDLAEVELDKVARVEAQLEAGGHRLPDGQELLNDARKRLRESVEHWNNKDFVQAYKEAVRSLRPLRILMRAQWEQATKGLDTPVASPYAVSFYTLPRHWQFMDQFPRPNAGATEPAAPNALPDGGFERGPGQNAPETWTIQEARLDPVELVARRVTEQPQEGRQCLMLEIKPQDPQLPPKALERTFLALHSPTVRLQPGTRVRISGWMRIPQPIAASVDGALLYDSAGGEPLAVRLTNSTGWKKFTLYRWVPASGTINVTVALTGLGKVYFDDIRIEPVTAPGPVSPSAGDKR